MTRLNKKLLLTLAFGLLFAFGFALAFSSCGGDDDDDSRGGDDDDDDDDSTDDDDDDTADCEKACLDSWKNEYVACLNAFISCLDSGGDPNTCVGNMASCVGAAESNMCVCGTNCDSKCLSALCTCREGCAAGDQACYDACFISLSDCTGWFDGACYNNCYAQLQSCISTCKSGSDFSACYTCITTYSSCVDGCY